MKQYAWNFPGDTPLTTYHNREVCIEAARQGAENLTRLSGVPCIAEVHVSEDGGETVLVGLIRASITSTWTSKEGD